MDVYEQSTPCLLSSGFLVACQQINSLFLASGQHKQSRFLPLPLLETGERKREGSKKISAALIECRGKDRFLTLFVLCGWRCAMLSYRMQLSVYPGGVE
jgi:hypothetical protein